MELDSKTELYYLGHHLTLKNCTLVIRVPERALVISKTQLINCTVEAKRELKGFRWGGVILKGCKFTGAFSGCEFGRWPYADEPEFGSIEDCDFSGARLEACVFMSCDARTLKFPTWPCFTILEPVVRKNELLSIQWPGTMHITVESFVEGPPETAAVTYFAAAVTYFAPAVAKRTGTTVEAIRAVLDTLTGVIL